MQDLNGRNVLPGVWSLSISFLLRLNNQSVFNAFFSQQQVFFFLIQISSQHVRCWWSQLFLSAIVRSVFPYFPFPNKNVLKQKSQTQTKMEVWVFKIDKQINSFGGMQQWEHKWQKENGFIPELNLEIFPVQIFLWICLDTYVWDWNMKINVRL